MTKLERQYLADVQSLGCIVCRLQGLGNSIAEVHHILDCNRRKGHAYTIPLCVIHHREGINTKMAVSRHPWKHEFEKRYGSEDYLLEETRKLLEQLADNTV